MYKVAGVITHKKTEVGTNHYIYNHYIKEKQKWLTIDDENMYLEDSENRNEQGTIFIMEKVKPDQVNNENLLAEKEDQRNKHNHRNFLRLTKMQKGKKILQQDNTEKDRDEIPTLNSMETDGKYTSSNLTPSSSVKDASLSSSMLILPNEPTEDLGLSIDTAEATPYTEEESKTHTGKIPLAEHEEYMTQDLNIPAVQTKVPTVEVVHSEENRCRGMLSPDTADTAPPTDVVNKTHTRETLASVTNKNLQTKATSLLNTRSTDEEKYDCRNSPEPNTSTETSTDPQYDRTHAYNNQSWRGNTARKTYSRNQPLNKFSKALRQREYYSSKTYYKNKTKPNNTQPRRRKKCVYYLNDCCIFGKSCYNIHEDTPSDDHDDTNENEENIQVIDNTSPFRAGAQPDWAYSEYW